MGVVDLLATREHVATSAKAVPLARQGKQANCKRRASRARVLRLGYDSILNAVMDASRLFLVSDDRVAA